MGSPYDYLGHIKFEPMLIEYKIPKGALVIRLEENASNADGVQWSKVKTFGGIVGYASAEYLQLVKLKENPNLEKISIDSEKKIVNCIPIAKISDLLEKSANAIVKDKDGNIIEDTTKLLATGNKITIGENEYSVVKKGDVTGDGKANSKDAIKILKYFVDLDIIEI